MATRRQFFQTTGIAALAATLTPSTQAAECPTTENRELHYDCFGPHQAGITTPHQSFGILCAFDVVAENRAALEKLLRTITARIQFLTPGGTLSDSDPKLPPAGSGLLGQHFPPEGLTITVGVGHSLFDNRFGLTDALPKHLREMRSFKNDKLERDWCDGDISIQICASRPEACQNALRDLLKNTTEGMIIRWTVDGFLPATTEGHAARNLFGFHDGTGNPDVSNPDIADQVLWVGHNENSADEPAWAKNGSYQAIRIIRQFVEQWDRTPLQEQEEDFGREKYSGAPIGMKYESDIPDYKDDPKGEKVPLDSHMRLANPRTADFKKHLLFRRPFNYSRGLTRAGQLDVGLILSIYQANLDDGFIFVQHLLDDEPIEEYISPFGGGYFFILPGFSKQTFLGQSLLEATS